MYLNILANKITYRDIYAHHNNSSSNDNNNINKKNKKTQIFLLYACWNKATFRKVLSSGCKIFVKILLGKRD